MDEKKDTYVYFRELFINNGKNSKVANESVRKNIVEKFEKIDRKIRIRTTPTDGLFLAEMLLNMQAEGDIVECGCFTGGSTAKLSILAKLLNRKFFIFDSFEGLPEVEQFYLRDQHCRRSDSWIDNWDKGRYAASLDTVKENIERYGEISVCQFIKGWFNKTFIKENLPNKVSFVFADVDIASSARDCFVAFWPLMLDNGIYVIHDTAFIKVLLELYNPILWKEIFKTTPPILFGAGYGLCDESPHVGYMVKGSFSSSEYFKSLTIDK